MLFRQIRAADGVQCAYVVGDVERGWAVVIDPVPSIAPTVDELLERHDLSLRAVLETSVRREPVGAAQSRFSEMIRLLGAAPSDASPPVSRLWDDVDRGGPIEPWRGPSGDAPPRVLFSWSGHVRELCPQGTEIYDPRRDTLGLQFGAAVLRIDGTELLALPVGDRPDAVAYLVEDRLVTGAMLWSDGGAPGGPRTGDALFELPSDTWVYPKRVAELDRAILADERRAWRHHHSSDRTAPPLEERGFLPVVASLGDGPAWTAPAIGTRDASGYVDVVPADALLHRDGFARVVLVADPRLTERTFLGAEVRSHRDVVRSASGWDEDEPVLVASEMGELCRATCRALVHNGIRHVYRMVGGLNLWESCGLPTERSTEQRRRA